MAIINLRIANRFEDVTTCYIFSKVTHHYDKLLLNMNPLGNAYVKYSLDSFILT